MSVESNWATIIIERCLHCQTLIGLQITFEGTLSQLYTKKMPPDLFSKLRSDLNNFSEESAKKMMVMISREREGPLRFTQGGSLASDGGLLSCSYCNDLAVSIFNLPF